MARRPTHAHQRTWTGGSGQLKRLARKERDAELRARLEAGPRESDGVCTLRGRDVQRILDEEFGVKYSLQAVYDTLHRLGYSCLVPRPRHEKQDPEPQAKFKEELAPILSAPCARPSRTPHVDLMLRRRAPRCTKTYRHVIVRERRLPAGSPRGATR